MLCVSGSFVKLAKGAAFHVQLLGHGSALCATWCLGEEEVRTCKRPPKWQKSQGNVNFRQRW